MNNNQNSYLRQTSISKLLRYDCLYTCLYAMRSMRCEKNDWLTKFAVSWAHNVYNKNVQNINDSRRAGWCVAFTQRTFLRCVYEFASVINRTSEKKQQKTHYETRVEEHELLLYGITECAERSVRYSYSAADDLRLTDRFYSPNFFMHCLRGWRLQLFD